MKNYNVTIEEHVDDIKLYGLSRKSNDDSIANDIPQLTDDYHKWTTLKRVLPLYILSKNYDEETGNFDLFIGSTSKYAGLNEITVPSGTYARITIRPKLGFLWGMAIGEAKVFFYKTWLQNSAYEAVNMEYEHHTEKSTGMFPSVDIIFAIQKKHQN